MLCLSRRVGEDVVILGQLTVRVLGVSHGVVRLGFEGPREIDVKRSELIEKPNNRRVVQ